MTTVILRVEIPEDLYNKFYRSATDKQGKWRGSKQPAEKAFQTAIQTALQYFMYSLEDPTLTERMIKAVRQ